MAQHLYKQLSLEHSKVSGPRNATEQIQFDYNIRKRAGFVCLTIVIKHMKTSFCLTRVYEIVLRNYAQCKDFLWLFLVSCGLINPTRISCQHSVLFAHIQLLSCPQNNKHHANVEYFVYMPVSASCG